MIIDESTPADDLFPPGMARGLVPRDYALYPKEMFAPVTDIPMIPRSEWDARIKEQEEQQSSLEHIWRRSGQEVLNQNPEGYCWAYSTGAGIMASRMANNQPNVRVSPHAVACKIMNFKDKGGWCGLSAKFAEETGYPDTSVWPERSMSRQWDNAITWENAGRHKVLENFVDLSASHYYYQNIPFDLVASCLLLNLPCPTDFDWWGHSVLSARLVRIEAGSYGLRGPNSWGPGWGDNGWFTLRDTKAIPNSALCIRSTTPSA